MPAGKRITEHELISILIGQHDIKGPQDIPNELLEYIYRLRDEAPPVPESDDLLLIGADDKLEGTSKNGPAAVRQRLHEYIACDNLWTSKDSVRAALEVASRSRTASKGSSTGTSVNGKKRKLVRGKDTINVNKDHECGPEACRGNPRCLNWLGQADWEDQDRAYKAFANRWGLGDDPHVEVREPDLPVGLKNLGATCYVNSFLQVWYRDPAFRSGVFACRPSPSKPLDQQPLFQLQVLFAALQAGPCRAFSPVDLVKSLGLNDQEQQDAQEFAKLFMDLLDAQFKKQADPVLRSLVATQFEGQMRYSTKCLKCSTVSQRTSTYREIEIALRKAKTLHEGLVEVLQPETLRDDNRYRCERCDSLQNAERQLVIDSLPPVMHISLLRFYYDVKSESRKKSSAMIKFPQSIDMQPYLGDRVDFTGSPLWYDLRAVLLHEGTSAMCGHYTAQIYDSSQNDWYRFDDDSVYKQDLTAVAGTKASAQSSDVEVMVSSTRAKRKLVPDSESDGDDIVVSSIPTPVNGSNRARSSQTSSRRPTSPYPAANGRRSESIQIDDSDDDKPAARSKSRASSEQSHSDDKTGQVSSKNAYMLVYVRRDSTAAHTQDVHMQSDIPAEAERKMQDYEKARTAALVEFDAREKQCKDEFAQALASKRSVFGRWADCDDEASSFLVDSTELSSWLTRELRSRKKTDLNVVDTSKQDASMKEMSTQTAPVANGFTRPASPITAASGDESHPTRSAQSVAEAHSSLTASTINNYKLQCDEHDVGKICLKAATRYKRISQLAFAQMHSLGVNIEPAYTTLDLCRRCAWRTYADDEYRWQHAQHLSKFRSLQDGHGDAVWISKEWLEEWKKTTPRLEAEDGSGNDLGPHDAAYLCHVQCEHGMLLPANKSKVLITGRQATFLRTLFPAWNPWRIDERECQRCQQLSSEVQQRQQDLVLVAKQISASDAMARIIKPLLNKLTETAENYQPRQSTESCNLVPSVWMRSLIRWLKAPLKFPCPMAVDFGLVLCDHNELIVDFNLPAERGNLTVLSSPEWTSLISYEPFRTASRKGIRATLAPNGTWSCTTPVCKGCWHARRTNFTEADIVIHFIDSENDLYAIPADHAVAAEEVTTAQFYTSVANDAGVRRSSRMRPSQAGKAASGHPKVKRKPLRYKIRKHETFKDVRADIAKDIKTPALYLRFFYNGREIDNANETMESIGIAGGEAFHVLEVDAGDDGVDITQLEGIAPPTRANGRSSSSGKQARVEGFTGTGLLGQQASLDDVVQQPDERALREEQDDINRQIQLAAEMGNNCAQCTFKNAPGMIVCEMCSEPLAAAT